jgi:hypothetical protein
MNCVDTNILSIKSILRLPSPPRLRGHPWRSASSPGDPQDAAARLKLKISVDVIDVIRGEIRELNKYFTSYALDEKIYIR